MKKTHTSSKRLVSLRNNQMNLPAAAAAAAAAAANLSQVIQTF